MSILDEIHDRSVDEPEDFKEYILNQRESEDPGEGNSSMPGVTSVYAVMTPSALREQKQEQIMNIKLHRGTTRKLNRLSTYNSSFIMKDNNRGSFYMRQNISLPGQMSRQTSESSASKFF